MLRHKILAASSSAALTELQQDKVGPGNKRRRSHTPIQIVPPGRILRTEKTARLSGALNLVSPKFCCATRWKSAVGPFSVILLPTR